MATSQRLSCAAPGTTRKPQTIDQTESRITCYNWCAWCAKSCELCVEVGARKSVRMDQLAVATTVGRLLCPREAHAQDRRQLKEHNREWNGCKWTNASLEDQQLVYTCVLNIIRVHNHQLHKTHLPGVVVVVVVLVLATDEGKSHVTM